TMELFWSLKPAALVETGTAHGGSATFYADIAKAFDLDCRVITIDINPKWNYDPASKGILSLVGYSTDGKIHQQARSAVEEARRKRDGAVLVILDSDHHEAHVLQEPAEQTLRQLGHETVRFPWHGYFKPAGALAALRPIYRAQDKYLLGPQVDRLNADLVACVRECGAQALFVYRGSHIYAETLR